ncbi:MAG TPA: hypothetical protein VG712_04330 [Gemmatimonadales bacterium]|nr:hypothetical protein [Gemmatimonadales bacterium]
MKSASSGRAPFSIRRTILFGGLAVGVTDILWAIVMNGLKGRSAVWVLQSVAGGLLGSATFQGELRTALLGMACHFTIATCWFTAFFLVTRRWSVLVRRPWVAGPLYGLFVYVMMYQVVLPLSAYHTAGIRVGPELFKGLFIHIFGVGVLTALIARKGHPAS